MADMTTIKDIPVYEVRPTGAGNCKGGLIVIHEVWGLTDHIKAMAVRYAAEGYHVIAPNLLSETDIHEVATTEMQHALFNPEKRSAVQPKLREMMAPLQSPDFAAATIAKVQDCFDYLYEQTDVGERVGVVGYCFGGSYSFSLAVAEPKLLASIPYYGHAEQSVEELSNITCPVLAFYGEKDERLIASLPDLEERMNEARVDFTAQVYSQTGHAFNNDTNPFAYNKSAATDAWKRSLDFLDAAMQELPT